MTTELTLLAWTLVLALVQIALTAILRTAETGPAYNAGPRDEPGPPVGGLPAVWAARRETSSKPCRYLRPLF